MKLTWTVKHYQDLSKNELYDVLALRMEVFIVEQNCPYQDADGKDQDAYHVLGVNNLGKVLATARILKKGVAYNEIAVGRVVTAKSIRLIKKGHELMNVSMAFIKEKLGDENVRLSAQAHLLNYYSKYGFKSTGKKYLEDGIPHVEMLKI